MDQWAIVTIAIIITAGGLLALIAVICNSAQVKPTIGGVYRTNHGNVTGNVTVTVIAYNNNIVQYEFKDPDHYGWLEKGSMKLSEFNRIFVYLYTDYKTLVYKINRKR